MPSENCWEDCSKSAPRCLETAAAALGRISGGEPPDVLPKWEPMEAGVRAGFKTLLYCRFANQRAGGLLWGSLCLESLVNHHECESNQCLLLQLSVRRNSLDSLETFSRYSRDSLELLSSFCRDALKMLSRYSQNVLKILARNSLNIFETLLSHS